MWAAAPCPLSSTPISTSSRCKRAPVGGLLQHFEQHSDHSAVQGALLRLHLLRGSKKPFVILENMSGVIHPGRMTLLLGPPGSGKSTLLQALAGKFHHSGTLEVGTLLQAEASRRPHAAPSTATSARKPHAACKMAMQCAEAVG